MNQPEVSALTKLLNKNHDNAWKDGQADFRAWEEDTRKSGSDKTGAFEKMLLKSVFFLKHFGRRNTASLFNRLESLEKRVIEIEKAGVKFCGVHQRALSYKRGNIVVKDSACWACVTDETDNAPGESADWQLILRGARS